MRRILAMVLLAAAVGAISFLGSGASDDTGTSYLVDAEFRNAFSIIPGEDVKIAGVKVGKIKDLDVTDRQTASVLLEITEPGFGDWRSDAECTIRPQSLIGEKFVECTPTQPRVQGSAPAALLKTRDLDGETVAVLPVDRTRRPVDLDLVGNITRLPYRQRLTVLLNEFGAGVAGRGQDLQKIIRTADPSLQATDQVLDILAKQDDVLRKLAVDSDTALAPLARDRDRIADFVTQTSKVAKATADQRVALEAGFQRLPRFLRELRPTMQQLGSLSEQGTPLLRDLNTSGPAVSRFIRQLGPFSASATTSLTSLGDASVTGRTALNRSKPIIADLKNFAGTSKGVATNLRLLTESLKDTGGIERFLDYAFYQVAAVNGFDQFGHYLRAQLLVNLCSAYVDEPDPQCIAKFVKQSGTTSSRAATSGDDDPVLARTRAVLRGADADAIVAADKAAGTPRGSAIGDSGSGSDASASSAGRRTTAAPKLPTAVPGASSAGTSSSGGTGAAAAGSGSGSGSGSTEPSAGVSSLLDYLLGSGK